ncbi:MAG: helix-turn-helix transcriptional regulator [Pseudomonadota bacterium]
MNAERKAKTESFPEINVDDELEITRQNLRLAIAIRGTNATAVSLQAGLSVNTLTTFLRGKSEISHEKLIKVCRVLNIPVGILSSPDAITPSRINLHETLQRISPERLAWALDLLEDRERGQ